MQITNKEERIAKFIYELESEDRLVRVGLKDKLEAELIYKKYQDLFNKKTFEFIKAKTINSTGEEKEILQRIYYLICAMFVGNKTANLSDSIQTLFTNAKVTVDGRKIPYFQIGPKIAKEQTYSTREKLADSATQIIKKSNPLEQKLLNMETSIKNDLGFDSYISFFESSKKVDYLKFSKVVVEIKAQTDKLWQKTMGYMSKEVLGVPFTNVQSCHMNFLRSMHMYDGLYPKSKILPIFRKFVGDLGFSDLLENISIDDANRPKKNPRAVCYWPNPPSEVHLVIKPIGGEQDYEAMFHEGGHALHGASVNGNLPYTFRTIARSNALTEAYAFILEDLTFDPMWLEKYLKINAKHGNEVEKHAYFVNLMLLRRYLGKFLYEYEMFSNNETNNGPKLYKKYLDEATGFIHKQENWLVDMDSGFYSADYLRAWIGAAQLKDYILKKFGRQWYLNRKSGKFLRELWGDGVKWELEEVVAQLGYKPWDTTLLVASYKNILN